MDAKLTSYELDLLDVLSLYALSFDDEKQARAEFGDAAVDREIKRRAVIAKALGDKHGR